MATQNQGNTNKVYGSFGYDNPTYVARQSQTLGVSTAGSGATSGTKFVTHCAVTLWGVTFATVAAGTSTYTVNGTATSPATSIYALYVTNTNTATNSVALGTTTVGAVAGGFIVGGTTTTGANVNVGGIGGVAGGYQGPYSLNTLGGTNTSQTWGTNTFTVSPPGGANAGLGGLPMAPGDTLQFVNGTDATATWIAIVHFTPAFGAVVPL